MNLPEIVDIQAFIACVEHRSFSAAARIMNVPRQTVTRRIDRLETVLAVQLIKRSQKDVQTTDAGFTIYEHAKKALEGMQAFVDTAHENSSVLQGRLRITSMPLDWGPLRQMIHDFHEAHPAVHIEILTSTRYVDLVHENFDIAIRGGTNIPPDAVARPLGQVQHLVMGSTDYLAKHGTPRCLEDLSGHQFISCFNDNGTLESNWQTADGTNFSFSPSFCTNDLVMRRDAVVAGHGLAVLPDLAVKHALHTGKLVPVLTDVICTTATFALVYLPSKLMRPVVRSFVDFAIDWVGTQTDWLEQPLIHSHPTSS